MSQQLLGRSQDLKRLRDEGYELQVSGGYLIIHHIPYVNNNRMIQYGKLVTELTLLADQRTGRPNTHVIHFNGQMPCHKDGTPITAIQHADYGFASSVIYGGVLINFSFSNKPQNGYSDYYEKVVRYCDIITGPAKSLNPDPAVTEKTFKVYPDDDNASVFQYIDTNSSRAHIDQLNEVFKSQKVAIIGLGGTGSYIFDQVAKTPVSEVHLFDGDLFHAHNAFRSPGAASLQQLEAVPSKVAYYASIYSSMHKRIIPHAYYMTEERLIELAGMSYVFLCIDNNAARNMLMEGLLAAGIPFIDVGLGVHFAQQGLVGQIRVTVGTSQYHNHLPKRVPSAEDDDNAYGTNIQISDLNMLNAALAVVKWKKMCGFYQDLLQEHNSNYAINVAQLLNNDTAA